MIRLSQCQHIERTNAVPGSWAGQCANCYSSYQVFILHRPKWGISQTNYQPDKLPVQAYLTLQLAFGFYPLLHFLGVEGFGYVTVINTNCDWMRESLSL